MGELSTAAASRKPCSLQRKRAFRVACSCFFWNTRNAISIANFWYHSTSPSRTHRKEYGRLPFSRVPELFHVSAGLRFRRVDRVSTPRRKATHTSTDRPPVRFDLNGAHKLSHVGVFAERPTPTGYVRHVRKGLLDRRKPSHSRLRLRGALQRVSAMSPH